MLLTGFDAPVEQVIYLDKAIIAHNLLQAIVGQLNIIEKYTIIVFCEYQRLAIEKTVTDG